MNRNALRYLFVVGMFFLLLASNQAEAARLNLRNLKTSVGKAGKKVETIINVTRPRVQQLPREHCYPCQTCKGTGKIKRGIYDSSCSSCGGDGIKVYRK